MKKILVVDDNVVNLKFVDKMLKSNEVKAEIKIVFQDLAGLHKACPHSPGDWYFSGDYPTYGGTRRVNQAFVNYYENIYIKNHD